MNSKKFFQWCRTAVSRIRYRPDRDEVHKELYQHLEDRYESFRLKGMDFAEAEDKAVEAMGRAEEIAPQMAEIHNSPLPYILIITRCILVLLCVINIIPFFDFVAQIDLSKPNYQDFYPLSEYDPYLDTEYKFEGVQGNRIIYMEPDCYVAIDGYTVSVNRASLWSYQYSDDREKEILYFDINAFNPRIWAEPTQAVRMFYAVDNLGRRYFNIFESGESEDARFTGNVRKTGLFTTAFQMYISNFDSDDVQWIDLKYDRDGRDVVMRIYLTGGEENEKK